MVVCIATGNRGKFLEIADILKSYGMDAVQKPMKLDEEGETLEERAESKARKAWNALKKPVAAEDTGIFFKAFGNFPGVDTKKCFLEHGLEGITRMLDGKSRDAYFKTVICYYDSEGPRFFSGIMKGKIAKEIRMSRVKSLPYERIFIPEGYSKTISELGQKKKNRISHRAEAAEKLAVFLKGKILK